MKNWETSSWWSLSAYPEPPAAVPLQSMPLEVSVPQGALYLHQQFRDPHA